MRIRPAYDHRYLPVVFRLVCLVVAALATATCALDPDTSLTPPPPTSSSTTTSSTIITTTTVPGTGATAPSTTQPAAACPEGDVMLADGQLLEFDRPTSDASRIAGITWRAQGGCHVVTISFATEDGAPATTPPALDARLLRGAGVLRVETDTTASVVVDQLVEEGPIERLFVPVTEDGSRFVDFVLTEPTVARARILTSPARLEVEMQAGGPEMGQPLVSSQVVLVEPGSEAVAAPVLDVAGYSTGDLENLELAVLLNDAEVAATTLELDPGERLWRTFDLAFQIGEPYDTLRVTTEDGSVIAAVPLSP
ncbi:MAG: hypothetical protein ACLFWM_12995 [Actinomycetota bacterium]